MKLRRHSNFQLEACTEELPQVLKLSLAIIQIVCCRFYRQDQTINGICRHNGNVSAVLW